MSDQPTVIRVIGPRQLRDFNSHVESGYLYFRDVELAAHRAFIGEQPLDVENAEVQLDLVIRRAQQAKDILSRTRKVSA